MKRYDFGSVANAVVACATAALLLMPILAYSVQYEPSKSTVIGNPIDPGISSSIELKSQKLASDLPDKNQIALQFEIEKLRALADKIISNQPNRTNRTIIRQRQQAANASWVLGLLYANGLGVDVDYREAQIRFKKAYDLGEPLAAAGLAWCEIQGCETLPSAHDARVWIERLRSVQLGRAIYLEWLVEQTFLPLQANSALDAANVNNLAPKRRELLLNAAKSRDIQALIELGFDAVSGENLNAAYDYFKTAAPNSVIAAQNAAWVQNRLQNVLQTNCKIQDGKDLDDSVLLASAQALHRGIACQINYVEAIRLYTLSARKGNETAKRMLSLIYSRQDAGGRLNISWMQQLANLNVTNLALNINSASLVPMLKREPTPLYDLIPQNLRKLAISDKS